MAVKRAIKATDKTVLDFVIAASYDTTTEELTGATGLKYVASKKTLRAKRLKPLMNNFELVSGALIPSQGDAWNAVMPPRIAVAVSNNGRDWLNVVCKVMGYLSK
jgi:hypothetical protein